MERNSQLKSEGITYRFWRNSTKPLFRKVNTKTAPPSVQMMWLLDMDMKLRQAMSNVFCSPFRPAPILKNMIAEFNIFKMPFFDKYLDSVYVDVMDHLPFHPEATRKKFLPKALKHFNDVVVCRRE